MEPTPENLKAFHHARWRVKFTAYMLALHEGVQSKGSLAWIQQQADFINRHSLAKETLAAYPQDWHERYPMDMPLPPVNGNAQ